MKLYTWEDLCDFEFLLGEKYRISHMIRAIDANPIDEADGIRKRLYCKYLRTIDEAVKELGREVPEDKATVLLQDDNISSRM